MQSSIASKLKPTGTGSKQSQYNSKQFDRIRVLGKGSFGTAVVHRRRADCSLVVLKEIDLQRFKGEEEKELAINEARIMSTLSHANIINYHNAYTTETKLIIEMEYARLGTLATYLSLQMQPLEEQEILVIFRQICSGLNYLHSRNIIHLDLKMANLFVSIDGLVKIGDFGIAQYMRAPSSGSRTNNLPQHGGTYTSSSKKIQPPHSGSQMLGTPAYSSPERCLGEQTDYKSDIWSLGCILYELITSQPLFRGDSLPELVFRITRVQYQPVERKDIAPALLELFEKLIVREPSERLSAKQLLTITDQLLARIQLCRQKLHTARTNRQRSYGGQQRFDLSTEVAWQAANGHNKDTGQLNYLHSIIYHVRMDTRHVEMDRVNLSQMKRIKEICKGKSHYLVLTYDSVVYGWGDKSHGQLGACGFNYNAASSSAASSLSSRKSSEQTAYQAGMRSSNSDLRNVQGRGSTQHLSSSSGASSTQTIMAAVAGPANQPITQTGYDTGITSGKQLVFSMLKESQASTRPFIINELNHRKIVQVAAGDNFSVFLNKTGIVMTCGNGSTGCLGRGSFQGCFTPCMVESLLNSDVVAIASGPEHVVAVCGNGRAFAWGNSGHGRLGIGGGPGVAASQQASELDKEGKYVLRPRSVQFKSQAKVFIKSVFCGDKCTVFIDLNGRCWATGENRSNKLGLDERRRFKKTLIVDQCWQPTEIGPLAKYKIVGCNIGKNHSSFITSEGKLIVFGQDIDQTYRLRSNIMSARESQRRISSELSTRIRKVASPPPYNRRPAPIWSAVECRRLAKSTIYNNQLAGFKRKLTDDTRDSRSEIEVPPVAIKSRYPRYKLTRAQLQQIEHYVRKSRAYRKMPFECVISVRCTSKFTLALTSDNRIYFWGTRSHRKDDDSCILQHCAACLRRQAKSAAEPQLISHNNLDECFIKIGATNESLMSSIQTLGSDQPIIHAQDPKLTARTAADLWILDYRPSNDSVSSSSASEDDESSTNNNRQSFQSASSSTTCFPFSGCRDNIDSCSSVCSLSNSSSCSECCRAADEDFAADDEDDADFCTRHDAILTPQPIVSLYVPSMYNHHGCTLHLADLFCFDEDRFYLVLDTTISTHHTNHTNSSCPPSRPSSGFKMSGKQASNNNNINNQAQKTHNASLETGDTKLACASTQLKNEGQPGAECHATSNEDLNNAAQCCLTGNETTRPQSEGCCHDSEGTDDINNNDTRQTTSTSHGGVSMEEPRSLSTFGGPSMGGNAQIIMGPGMRSIERDQTLRPLNFDANNQLVQSDEQTSQQSDRVECQVNIAIQPCSDDSELTVGACAGEAQTAPRGGCPLLMMKRRHKRIDANKSRYLSNDIEETSSMPSWVRNEFMQQQQFEQPVKLAEDDNSSASDDKLPVGEIDTGTPESFPIHRVDDLSTTTREIEPPTDASDECNSWPIHQSASSSSTCASLDDEISSRKQQQLLSVRDLGEEPVARLSGNKQQFVSRSQPDMSEMLDVRVESCEQLERRASVLHEDDKLAVHASNLLECNIYRRGSRSLYPSYTSQYQSSIFTSAPSTRANSHSPLIRPDSSPRSSRQASMIPPPSSKVILPGVETAPKMDRSDSGPIFENLPMQSNARVETSDRSEESHDGCKTLDRTSGKQMSSLTEKHRVFRSTTHLNQISTLKGDGQSASGFSLASQFRKSLIKLFC